MTRSTAGGEGRASPTAASECVPQDSCVLQNCERKIFLFGFAGNSLKKLDSRKRIQVNSFPFLWSSFRLAWKYFPLAWKYFPPRSTAAACSRAPSPSKDG